jgi:hypothetical protein
MPFSTPLLLSSELFQALSRSDHFVLALCIGFVVADHLALVITGPGSQDGLVLPVLRVEHSTPHSFRGGRLVVPCVLTATCKTSFAVS